MLLCCIRLCTIRYPLSRTNFSILLCRNVFRVTSSSETSRDASTWVNEICVMYATLGKGARSRDCPFGHGKRYQARIDRRQNIC